MKLPGKQQKFIHVFAITLLRIFKLSQTLLKSKKKIFILKLF